MSVLRPGVLLVPKLRSFGRFQLFKWNLLQYVGYVRAYREVVMDADEIPDIVTLSGVSGGPVCARAHANSEILHCLKSIAQAVSHDQTQSHV